MMLRSLSRTLIADDGAFLAKLTFTFAICYRPSVCRL